MAVYVTRAGVALTVGIIVLTGVVVGGLFLLKHQGEQARRDEAITIAEQQLEQQSNDGVALNEGDQATTEEESSQSSGDNAATNNSRDEQASESNSSSNTDVITHLPETGSSDLVSLVAIALLTFTGVSYIASRRSLSQQ